MKKILVLISLIVLISLAGCKKRTCTCVDAFGNVQTGIDITWAEECSDLDHVMGTCTPE